MKPGRGRDDFGGADRADETGPELVRTPSPIAMMPTGSARTAPTAPVAPGRRRRLVFALTIFLLGVAAVAGAIYWSGDYREERDFQKRAEAVLVQLGAGKAGEIYEQASARFQQTLLASKFQDLVERMNATLGRFVRVADVLRVERAASVAGMTARITLELEFEQAATRGQLNFHRGGDGIWRLLGIHVDIPAELKDKAAALAARSARRPAPPAVIELVHSICEDVRAGRAAKIHEEASPAFKAAMTAQGFQAMLDANRRELGAFKRVLGIVSSAEDGDRAPVQALLEYEKAKTTGTFEFARVDGSWRLLSFKIAPGESPP